MLQSKMGTWKAYSPGSGPVAPTFPHTVTYVAGIPLNGNGNVANPTGGGRTNKVVRTGGLTPAGSNNKLIFK